MDKKAEGQALTVVASVILVLKVEEEASQARTDAVASLRAPRASARRAPRGARPEVVGASPRRTAAGAAGSTMAVRRGRKVSAVLAREGRDGSSPAPVAPRSPG